MHRAPSVGFVAPSVVVRTGFLSGTLSGTLPGSGLLLGSGLLAGECGGRLGPGGPGRRPAAWLGLWPLYGGGGCACTRWWLLKGMYAGIHGPPGPAAVGGR